MKKITIFLFALISMTIVFSSCTDYCEKYYIPELPFSLTPKQDTFYMGDTIWLSCMFPSDSIKDVLTGENISIAPNDFNFNTTLSFYSIGQNPHRNVTSFFDVFTEKGEVTLTSVDYLVNYFHEDNKYVCIMGIVPRKAGIYISIISSYRTKTLVELGNKCTERIEVVNYNLNKNVDNNYHLFASHPDTTGTSDIPLKDIKSFGDLGGYCFYVVE